MKVYQLSGHLPQALQTLLATQLPVRLARQDTTYIAIVVETSRSSKGTVRHTFSDKDCLARPQVLPSGS